MPGENSGSMEQRMEALEKDVKKATTISGVAFGMAMFTLVIAILF